MFVSQLVAAVALGVATVSAAPSFDKRASCTFSGATGAAQAAANKKSCSAIIIDAVAVPAGTTLDLTGLTSGTSVTFQGTTTFGYKEWAGPLVSISGTSITVTGASGAVLDGGGAKYWDGQGSNGGKTKPKFFFAHSLTSSTISNIKILNSPVQVFSIDGAKTLTLSGITVDNSAGDAGGGHNTDAFDIGDSDGVTITGAKVYNQDDCVAINSGTNIKFDQGLCSGGHGLSIGSVGGRSDNTVSGVTFSNSQVVKSQQAVRIKTISGATGTVKDITYENITIDGATSYGIVIDQSYNGNAGSPTSGVPITGVTLSGITGTVASGAVETYIDCASCSGWTWKNVAITGGKKSSSCKGVPSGVSC